jgi:hypothetical protein
MLASSITMMMFLPPISRWHFLKVGEADQAGVRIGEHRGAGIGAVAENDVHHAARQSGFGENLHQVVSGERRVFGGLDDDRVATDERRNRFPRWNRHREIPRRDQSCDADWRAHTHCKFVGQLGGSGLAELAAAFASHQVSHVDGFLHVAARFGEHFAHFARHVDREVFFALSENFSGAVENFGAFGRGREAPIFEGALRGVDRLVDVVRTRCREHADELARVRGVAIFNGFAAACGNPFAIDVILKDFGRYCCGHAKSSRFECNLKRLRRLDDDPALTTHDGIE